MKKFWVVMAVATSILCLTSVAILIYKWMNERSREVDLYDFIPEGCDENDLKVAFE